MVYRSGDYLAICDICGFRRYASECRLNWKKQFVCADTCYEEKHPQYKDPVGLHEPQTVPIYRPEVEEVFLSPGDVTPDDL